VKRREFIGLLGGAAVGFRLRHIRWMRNRGLATSPFQCSGQRLRELNDLSSRTTQAIDLPRIKRQTAPEGAVV
jgi:hypothetical protein